ncbi:MAG: diguanylate cyclase [Gemmatimonadota bacterium]
MRKSRITRANWAPTDYTPARVADSPLGSDQRVLLDEVYRDDDTGLFNRRAWNEARPRVDGDPDTEVLAVDIVGLKRTNDTLGHEAGDRLIGEVAKALSVIASEWDIQSRNLWRIGGDEFVVAVPSGWADEFGRRLEEAVGMHPIRGTKFASGVRYGVGADFSAADHALLVARDQLVQTHPRFAVRPS